VTAGNDQAFWIPIVDVLLDIYKRQSGLNFSVLHPNKFGLEGLRGKEDAAIVIRTRLRLLKAEDIADEFVYWPILLLALIGAVPRVSTVSAFVRTEFVAREALRIVG
jgi:hypothetical protein